MTSIENNLKDIVLNVKVPHIIKGLNIPWPAFKSSFQEWCAQFDNFLTSEEILGGGIDFDTGNRKHSNIPQWEKLRGKKKMTVKEFYERSAKGSDFFVDNWATYGYKNIKEMPYECAEGFDFSYFGFSEVKDDITFWLSSTDAHTPCHFDTYGCNIVVQVYGRKSWMLFPPNAKLTPTRIPYEESSVYCTETFFSPKDVTSYKDVEGDCYNYVLDPADVLVVPPKWWHYVENVRPSLSVNAWIPIESDVETQIEECIVRILMKNFIEHGKPNDFLDILNPNEIDLSEDKYNLFDILQYLVDQKSNAGSSPKHKHGYLSENELSALLVNFKEQIIPVPKISKEEFRNILNQRIKRFDPAISDNSTLSTESNIKYHLINAVCSPSIINQIKTDFLMKMNKKTS